MDNFPLRVTEVIRDFAQLPAGTSPVFYHYTCRAGLEGILRLGGLRATHRLSMNDQAEFGYARAMVEKVLDEIGRRRDLPRIAARLVRECRVNLERIPAESARCSRAYCACLSMSRDQESQWLAYADGGEGFALGFKLLTVLRSQKANAIAGAPFLFCLPVLYGPDRQRALVGRVCEAAIQDMQGFAESRPKETRDLTAFYHYVVREVFTVIITCIDFIKHPKWKDEHELRIMWDSNDGTFNVQNLQYLNRDGVEVPFLFLDLRNPATGRLPIEEIIVGPRAAKHDATAYVEQLLDEVGYGAGTMRDRPKVVKSSIRITN